MSDTRTNSCNIDPIILSSLIIDRSKPVLVTGATGYIAGVLIQQLLELGITVHATVRDVTQTKKYQYIQDEADKNATKIHFFSADLLIDGSFRDAMNDCSIVFHTASPVLMESSNPIPDLIEPAVFGTKNILKTASEIPTITRVILTSSSAAVSGHASDGYNASLLGTAKMLNEEHWNRASNLIDNPYAYSKTLAEQTAWIIAGSQTQWKLITINPSFVIGPGLICHHQTSATYQVVLKLVGNDNIQVKFGTMKIGMAFVDVRDVAMSHIVAAYHPKAMGRYLCTSHNGSFDDVSKALLTKYSPTEYPIPTFSSIMPKWLLYLLAPYLDKHLLRTFVWNNVDYERNYDNTKIQQELGIRFRLFTESVCEMYQQFIDNKIVTTIQNDRFQKIVQQKI